MEAVSKWIVLYAVEDESVQQRLWDVMQASSDSFRDHLSLYINRNANNFLRNLPKSKNIELLLAHWLKLNNVPNVYEAMNWSYTVSEDHTKANEEIIELKNFSSINIEKISRSKISRDLLDKFSIAFEDYNFEFMKNYLGKQQRPVTVEAQFSTYQNIIDNMFYNGLNYKYAVANAASLLISEEVYKLPVDCNFPETLAKLILLGSLDARLIAVGLNHVDSLVQICSSFSRGAFGSEEFYADLPNELRIFGGQL